MGVVTIEESADERAIVGPGLRVRFRWTGDRWTHALDLGPGPERDESWPWAVNQADGHWLLLAEAIEWESADSDPAKVVSPVFQELHFQESEGGAYALLVGRAGPHHFSGSFRVSDRIEELSDRITVRNDLRGYLPIVVADIAVRSSGPISSLATSYRIHNPLNGYPLATEWDDTGGCDRPSVLWECGFSGLGRHDFRFGGVPPSRLFMKGDGDGPWEARLVAGLDPVSKTQRYTYSWFHDCTTRHFHDVWRSLDPERDAYLRQVEFEREQWEAEERKRLEDPKLRAWLERMGIDPDSTLGD